MHHNSEERKGLLPLKFTIAFLLAASLTLIVSRTLIGNFHASCYINSLHLYIAIDNGNLQWFRSGGHKPSGNSVNIISKSPCYYSISTRL